MDWLATRFAAIGLCALFTHFGWYFGVLFGVIALLAYKTLKGWSTSPDYFGQPD